MKLVDKFVRLKSDCAKCKHFNALSCSAYPNGIPKELYNGDKKHRKKRPDQKGDAVFQSIL